MSKIGTPIPLPIDKFEERYQRALRRRAVADYVRKNKRSPSRAQVFELMHEQNEKFPTVNEVGFSGYELEKPSFGIPSSSLIENRNRTASNDDMITISKKTDDLIELLEDSFRGFKATANRCNRILQQIDARLNNLLLLSGRTDIFVYGIEESFNSQENIDLEKSTASVGPGYVTMRTRGYPLVDLSEVDISISTIAKNGILFKRSSGSLDAIKEQDGDIWEYYAYTTYATGEVSLVVELDLERHVVTNTDGIKVKPYVGDIRLTGNPIDTNSITKATVFYSIDGASFVPLQPVRQPFAIGENQFSLGRRVQKIRIILTKNAADELHGPENRKIYIFSLDSIELIEGVYRESKNNPNTKIGISELYAGPYELLDENGNPVNFGIATLAAGTCCTIPDRTSISFFLSKDNLTWIPASYNKESLSVVQFNITTPEGTYDFIDGGSHIYSLLDTPPSGVDIEFGTEVFLNTVISEEYADRIVLQNTFIKRNLPQSQPVYGVDSGWFYDTDKKQYSCSMYVEAIEGRYLDLGNTGAYINGKLVAGTIHLPQGYHSFATSFTNWYEVPADITNAIDLEEQDPVYPFNHKLMIEGYDYPSGFEGEQLYIGVTEYFGSLLNYVTPERFNDPSNDGNLHVYTIEEYGGKLYFKIKITPSDSSWTRELVQPVYMLRLDDSNLLYIKAILRSDNLSVTPHINSIQVRVV
jgi:hypothetical protein